MLINFYKKEHPKFDDNITIVEGKLSDYDLSIDSSCNSKKSNISYNSIDNKIIMDNDGMDIYKLKHDYCFTHGKEKYNIVLQKYNELCRKKDFTCFNEEIWLSSVDIYFNPKYVNNSCFNAIINVKKNNENIKKLYDNLLLIHNNTSKINLWHQACKECSV